MGAVDLAGAGALAAMVLCYALEHRGPVFATGFAVSCAAAAAYAWAIGAWPFAVLELLWAGLAARRAWRASLDFKCT